MNHEKFIEEARPLIKFVEGRGGPDMYEWVDTSYTAINEEDEYGNLIVIAECPPAVTAAIICWIMDAMEWLEGTYDLYVNVNPNGVNGWLWELLGYGDKKDITKDGVCDTKELAFLALLTAICEALGYEGETK